MRGLLWGTFGLAVLYAVVQPGAADRITAGGGLFATAVRRLSDPTVALIPNGNKSSPAATTAPPATNSPYGGTA